MKIDKVSKITTQMFKGKLVNYILGKRVCPRCAKKEWKDEDKSQSFTMLPGVCEVCHKPGIVAYIDN